MVPPVRVLLSTMHLNSIWLRPVTSYAGFNQAIPSRSFTTRNGKTWLSTWLVSVRARRMLPSLLLLSRLSPSHPLTASAAHLGYGQPVSFLGYLFGQDGGGEQINRGVPLPFVKAGIVSAMEFGDVFRIFLDAHGNKGFSGGPVVFVPYGQSNNELRVAGIVSSLYPYASLLPIVDRQGNPITGQGGGPFGHVRENPGIVVAIGIKHAVDLIDANPIGFDLPADKNHG